MDLEDQPPGTCGEGVEGASAGGGAEAGFAYDPSSGYYYDAQSGYYYDANTQLFYHPTTNEWYQHDPGTGEYTACTAADTPAASGAVAAGSAATGAGAAQEAGAGAAAASAAPGAVDGVAEAAALLAAKKAALLRTATLAAAPAISAQVRAVDSRCPVLAHACETCPAGVEREGPRFIVCYTPTCLFTAAPWLPNHRYPAEPQVPNRTTGTQPIEAHVLQGQCRVVRC